MLPQTDGAAAAGGLRGPSRVWRWARAIQRQYSLRDAKSHSARDFTRLYRAFYHHWLYRGLWGCCVQQLTVIAKYIILLWTVVFLLFIVDWTAVRTCAGAEECEHTNLVHAPSLEGMSLVGGVVALAFTTLCVVVLLSEIGLLVKVYVQQNEVYDTLDGAFALPPRTPIHAALRSAWVQSALLRAAGWVPLHGAALQAYISNQLLPPVDSGEVRQDTPHRYDDDDDEELMTARAFNERTRVAAADEQRRQLEQASDRIQFEGLSWQAFLHTLCTKVFCSRSQSLDSTSGDVAATWAPEEFCDVYNDCNPATYTQILLHAENYRIALTAKGFFRGATSIAVATTSGTASTTDNGAASLGAVPESERDDERAPLRRSHNGGAPSGGATTSPQTAATLRQVESSGGSAAASSHPIWYLGFVDETLIDQLISSHFNKQTKALRSYDSVREVLRYEFAFRMRTTLLVLLYPLWILWALLKFILRNVAAARASPSSLVQLELRTEARWIFRLFNEPQHLWEARIRQAEKHISAQIDATTLLPAWALVLTRFAQVGIIVATLFTVMNGTLLTSGSVFGSSIWWWGSIAIVLLVTFDASKFAQDREITHLTQDIMKVIYALAGCHVCFANPYVSGFHSGVTAELMRYKVLESLYLFIDTLTTPFVCWALLNTKAGDAELRLLYDAIAELSVHRGRNIGSVCKFADVEHELYTSLTDPGVTEPADGAPPRGAQSTAPSSPLAPRADPEHQPGGDGAPPSEQPQQSGMASGAAGRTADLPRSGSFEHTALETPRMFTHIIPFDRPNAGDGASPPAARMTVSGVKKGVAERPLPPPPLHGVAGHPPSEQVLPPNPQPPAAVAEPAYPFARVDAAGPFVPPGWRPTVPWYAANMTMDKIDTFLIQKGQISLAMFLGVNRDWRIHIVACGEATMLRAQPVVATPVVHTTRPSPAPAAPTAARVPPLSRASWPHNDAPRFVGSVEQSTAAAASRTNATQLPHSHVGFGSSDDDDDDGRSTPSSVDFHQQQRRDGTRHTQGSASFAPWWLYHKAVLVSEWIFDVCGPAEEIEVFFDGIHATQSPEQLASAEAAGRPDDSHGVASYPREAQSTASDRLAALESLRSFNQQRFVSQRVMRDTEMREARDGCADDDARLHVDTRVTQSAAWLSESTAPTLRLQLMAKDVYEVLFTHILEQTKRGTAAGLVADSGSAPLPTARVQEAFASRFAMPPPSASVNATARGGGRGVPYLGTWATTAPTQQQPTRNPPAAAAPQGAPTTGPFFQSDAVVEPQRFAARRSTAADVADDASPGQSMVLDGGGASAAAAAFATHASYRPRVVATAAVEGMASRQGSAVELSDAGSAAGAVPWPVFHNAVSVRGGQAMVGAHAGLPPAIALPTGRMSSRPSYESLQSARSFHTYGSYYGGKN